MDTVGLRAAAPAAPVAQGTTPAPGQAHTLLCFLPIMLVLAPAGPAEQSLPCPRSHPSVPLSLLSISPAWVQPHSSDLKTKEEEEERETFLCIRGEVWEMEQVYKAHNLRLSVSLLLVLGHPKALSASSSPAFTPLRASLCPSRLFSNALCS